MPLQQLIAREMQNQATVSEHQAACPQLKLPKSCATHLQEVENAYHSCALLIKLQLVEAQRADATLTVDTNQLENESLLQQIRACEQAALLRPATDFAAKRTGELSSNAAPIEPCSGQ
jgi:hypothetical protein